jgi:hypothetical protein
MYVHVRAKNISDAKIYIAIECCFKLLYRQKRLYFCQPMTMFLEYEKGSLYLEKQRAKRQLLHSVSICLHNSQYILMQLMMIA